MTARCRNCDARLGRDDRYCAACGQNIAEGGSRSLASLVRASVAEVSSLDSRLWRSLRGLLLRPGYLSRAYRSGRRRRYVSPIGLFLLGNLLFFLSPPVTDFQLSLAEQYEFQPYSDLIAPWVDAVVAGSQRSFDDIAEAYRYRVVELAKLMVIVHVPLLAFVTLLTVPDKRFFYADHVVLGLHYFAFLMIYLIATAMLFAALSRFVPIAWPAWLPPPAPLVFLLHLVYVPPMLRTALDLSWWRALLTTPVFVVGLVFAHFVYRLAQFVVCFVMVGG